jgi:hypothetical protein
MRLEPDDKWMCQDVPGCAPVFVPGYLEPLTDTHETLLPLSIAVLTYPNPGSYQAYHILLIGPATIGNTTFLCCSHCPAEHV